MHTMQMVGGQLQLFLSRQKIFNDHFERESVNKPRHQIRRMYCPCKTQPFSANFLQYSSALPKTSVLNCRAAQDISSLDEPKYR